MKLKEIKDTNIVGGTPPRLVNDGDNFYFEITLLSQAGIFKFISNKLVCKNDIDGTKLIHYTHKGCFDANFQTYFDYMPLGYNIRLQCEFLPLQQKANKEIFQNYYGTFDLVSAVPYETVMLSIGTENGIGVPDWLIRNLNHIFHLNEKKIDGVDYELVEGSELDTEIITGYNHRFLQIELCKKDITNTVKLPSATGTGNTTVIIREDPNWRTGTISILTTANFYLTPVSVSEFVPYSFSTLIAEGNTNVRFETTQTANTTTLFTTVEIRDLITHEIIGIAKLELPPINTGMCFMRMCDTFTLRC